jgi:hypothetical protein
MVSHVTTLKSEPLYTGINTRPGRPAQTRDTRTVQWWSFLSEQYPLGEFFEVLDGFDTQRSANLWEAVVVVEDRHKKRRLRLYRWAQREGKWKVDLARFDISCWNIDDVTTKIKALKEKWQV